MKATFFLLLICCSSYAQQSPPDFRVTLNDQSLIKVLRRYISIEQQSGLTKGKSVLVMTSVSILGNPEKDEWIIGATNSEKSLRYKVPALVSEIDGYPIVINFSGHTDQFIKYSDAYIDFVEKYIFSRLKENPINQTSSSPYNGWRVTFTKDKEPEIKAML